MLGSWDYWTGLDVYCLLFLLLALATNWLQLSRLGLLTLLGHLYLLLCTCNVTGASELVRRFTLSPECRTLLYVRTVGLNLVVWYVLLTVPRSLSNAPLLTELSYVCTLLGMLGWTESLCYVWGPIVSWGSMSVGLLIPCDCLHRSGHLVRSLLAVGEASAIALYWTVVNISECVELGLVRHWPELTLISLHPLVAWSL